MAEGLTKKEKGFADDYLETGNGTQSALNNYNTESYSTAGVIAHDNLKKPKILEYLQDHAEEAASMIFFLSQHAESEAIKLSASKDIMDRAGLKAPEKSINLNMNADIANPRSIEIAKKYEEELKNSL